MEIIGVDRPTWASKLYKSSFDTQEPANNPYAAKHFKTYAVVTGAKDKSSKKKIVPPAQTENPPLAPQSQHIIKCQPQP